MKPELQFDFVADKLNATLTIKREFAAKRALVWDCYTKSDLLNQWFAPKPLTTITRSMDFSEGGHWHYAMIDPAGAEYWGYTEYLSINPIENYTSMDGFCDAEGNLNPELPRAKWVVSFEEAGERCVVHSLIQYESMADLEKVIQMGMEGGLTSALERLDELLNKLV